MTYDSNPMDFGFLRRQTAGDAALERDLLGLFVCQCESLLPVLLQDEDPSARRDAAHSLRGAASALGARRVSEVAAAIEMAATAGELPSSVVLEHAIEATRDAIARHLSARAA